MDLEILKWVASTFHSQAWLNYIMRYITYLGEFGAVPIACALALLIFKKTRKGGLTCAVALILNFILVNALMKNVINRPRPWTEYEEFKLFYEQYGVRVPTDSSFPSGHTACCFCIAVACVCEYRLKALPALLLAFLVGLSRIYLCLHYPMDVLGGMAIGSACGVAGYFISGAIIKAYKTRKSREANAAVEAVEDNDPNEPGEE